VQDSITIRVWGPYALFCPPHFRGDPCSHPVMTPSGANGILRAIYHKPEFEWEVDAIGVLNPIQYHTMVLGGVNSHREGDRTLQSVTVLVDVAYTITARIVANPHRGERSEVAYYQQALRRLRKGEYYRQPHFGRNEYAAHYELLEGEIPAPIDLTVPLGSTLFNLMPLDLGVGDGKRPDSFEPVAWRAEIRNGVITVPRDLHDRYRERTMWARNRGHSKRTDRERAAAKLPRPQVERGKMEISPADWAGMQAIGPMGFLGALIARSRSTGVPIGYEEYAFSHVLHLDTEGAFLRFEELEKPRKENIPTFGRAGSAPVTHTAFDKATYAFGAGPADRDEEWVAVRHQAYREVNNAIDHGACRAISAFLDNPDRPLIGPEDCPLGTPDYVVPEGKRVLIEVQGYPQWWTDAPVANAHAARLEIVNEKNGAAPNFACLLCGSESGLARLFPFSKKLAGSFVTFNKFAWEGYGMAKGYNAPTCTDCAACIAIGLDDICARPGHLVTGKKSYMKDRYLAWWPTDPRAPALWPLLEIALDSKRADEEREEAIGQITDGHFASFSKLKTRLSLRRYMPTSADEVRARILRWNELCNASLWVMAGSLTQSGLKIGEVDFDHAARMELLACMLIGGEAAMPGVLRAVTRYVKTSLPDLESHTNTRRAGFLAWAGDPLDTGAPMSLPSPGSDEPPDLFTLVNGEERMSPSQRGMLNLGRCLVRADSLQRRRGVKVQKPVIATYYREALVRPQRSVGLLERYAQSKDRDGIPRPDKAFDEYMSRLCRVLPKRPNYDDQDAFRVGYSHQHAVERARADFFRAKKVPDSIAAK